MKAKIDSAKKIGKKQLQFIGLWSHSRVLIGVSRGKSGLWCKSSMSKDLFKVLFMEWSDTSRRGIKQMQNEEQPKI